MSYNSLLGRLSYILEYDMAAHTLSFRLLRLGAVGLATVGFMMLTTPAKIPALFLILPFVGIFSFLYLGVLEIIRFLGPDEDENGAIVQVRRPRFMAAVIAGFPALLLVLQSVVELTVWDVLIAVLILLLAYVYVSRGSFGFWKRR
jgi:hypothetical protein